MLQVAPEQRALVIEDPADRAVLARDLAPDPEVGGGQVCLEGEDAEAVPLRMVDGDRGPIEGDDRGERVAERLEKPREIQVGDDALLI